MYCKQCNTDVLQTGQFCPNCGGKLTGDIKATGNTSLMQFIDSQIQSQTTFRSAQDFMQGVKPLRFRWIITFIAAIVSFPIFCLAAIPVYILATFICAYKHLRLNGKKFDMPNKINIAELCDYLRINLNPFPFTEWQLGNPSALGLKDNATTVVQFVFEGKTVHRIVFEDSSSTYKITVQGATTKQHFLHGGTLASAGLLYKNAYRTQPVLAAAIEYYFQNGGAK